MADETKKAARKAVIQQTATDARDNLSQFWSDVGNDTISAAQGIVDAVPFATPVMDAAISKVRGTDVAQEAAKSEARLATGPGIAGQVAGNLIGGAAVKVVQGANVLRTVAANAALAMGIDRARQLSEEVKADQIEVTPSTVGAYWDAFSSHLESLGLSAVLGGVSGALHPAPRALERGVKYVAGEAAEAAASRLVRGTDKVEGAVAKSGMTGSEMLAKAEAEGMLADPTLIAKAKEAAGARKGALVDKLTPEHVNHVDIVEDMAQIRSRLPGDSAAAKTLAKAEELISAEQPNGRSMAERASALKADGGSKSLVFSDRQALKDAAKAIDARLAQSLDTISPELGREFHAANQDYRQYINMEKVLGRTEQVTAKGLGAKAVGVMAATKAGAVAGALLGPAGSGAGALGGLVASTFAAATVGKSSNYSIMKAIAQAPEIRFNEKLVGAVETLMSPVVAPHAASKFIGSYDRTEKLLNEIAADPIAYGDKIRDELDAAGIQPDLADALVLKQMKVAGDLYHLLPKKDGGTSLFAEPDGVSQMDKMAFERKVEAHFDPFAALNSNDPDRIKAAMAAHPEIGEAYAKQVLEYVQANKGKVPFAKRQAVGAVLGVNGSPDEDPLLGGHMQKLITLENAKAAEGQQNSARTVKAVVNRSAAVARTRADQVINPKAGK